MAEKLDAMENVEWSAGSRSRIQLCAMTPRRVCHSYCTRHSEKININGRSRSSGSRHCLSTLKVAVKGGPGFSGALGLCLSWTTTLLRCDEPFGMDGLS